MKLYVFYLSDIAVNVYEKETLSAQEKKGLKAEGFHKMPFETKAQSEAAAIDIMLEHFKENIAELKEFTKDYSVSATIFGLLYSS